MTSYECSSSLNIISIGYMQIGPLWLSTNENGYNLHMESHWNPGNVHINEDTKRQVYWDSESKRI